ncbi:MAG: redoxin domain-containing protein [Caldilineaceae bacterium]|nr:redoxin domain-containing protein [Caldilineaceae bacterium]
MDRSVTGFLLVAIVALVIAGCTAAVPLRSAQVPAVSQQAIRLPTPTPDPRLAQNAEPQAVAEAEPAIAPELAALLAKYPKRGSVPELTNEIWFNSEPLKLADLRGKVVMVEFWTYGCINCQHVHPALQQWHTEYADDGLVIIGVHTPEFAYEADLDNVQAAIERMGVAWPVAIDNDKVTWRAYANHYWPAMYLIDKEGQLRYLKIGEGQYDLTERMIQALLAEPA